MIENALVAVIVACAALYVAWKLAPRAARRLIARKFTRLRGQRNDDGTMHIRIEQRIAPAGCAGCRECDGCGPSQAAR